jgi:hypothetical protein
MQGQNQFAESNGAPLDFFFIQFSLVELLLACFLGLMNPVLYTDAEAAATCTSDGVHVVNVLYFRCKCFCQDVVVFHIQRMFF